jgi:hypothetical protein
VQTCVLARRWRHLCPLEVHHRPAYHWP